MEYIKYEKTGKVGYIMLNRPKLNLFNFEMTKYLQDVWKDFERDDELWVAILSSTCENFTAGFDIKEIEKMLLEGEFTWSKSGIFGDKGLSPDRQPVTKPIICALNGIVNGLGLWLVLKSDIRISTPKASFGLAEGKLNFPVEFAGFMTRYMPRAVVNEMLFTGRSITAQRFCELGILNKIVEEEQLMTEASNIAEDVCYLGPTSVRVMKQLVESGDDMDFRSLMTFSARVVVPAVNSEDTRKGVTSFLQKQKPVFGKQKDLKVQKE